MFIQKLQYVFISVVLLAIIFLATSLYEGYRFKTEPLSSDIQAQIDDKEKEIIDRIKMHYKIDFKVPLIITNDLPSKLYGLAVLDERRRIKIYINKKRIRESLDYILDDVIAHEYAHALMFAIGDYKRDDGHSKKWQNICLNLGGSRCDRFVNHQDVIYEKISF